MCESHGEGMLQLTEVVICYCWSRVLHILEFQNS